MTMVDGFFTDKKDITDWLRLNDMPVRDYQIHDDLSVSFLRDHAEAVLDKCIYEQLPIRINSAYSLTLLIPRLTTLKGLPEHLDGDLSLMNCTSIKSLEHCTRVIYGHLTLPHTMTSLVGIADHISVVDEISKDVDSIWFEKTKITEGGLGLLLIDNAWMSRTKQYVRPFQIIAEHMYGDRDVFACQQELIENNCEKWAQL